MRPFSIAAGLILACGLMCILLVGAPTDARADDPVGRLSLSVNFGVSGFAMDDVNREIGRANDNFFRRQNFTTMDDLSFGFAFLADFKTAIKDPFFISLGVGNLRGSTGVSFNEIVDISSKGNIFYGRLLYALPWRPLENGRLYVGGGPMLLRSVELEVSHERDEVAKRPERKEIMTFTGDGEGFQFGLLGEYLLSDHVTVAFDAGYRNASADLKDWNINVQNAETLQGRDEFPDDTQVWWSSYLIEAFLADPGEEDPENPTDGPPISTVESVDDLSVDFSGFRLEVGLRLYFF
jgi:hypothetical protein